MVNGPLGPRGQLALLPVAQSAPEPEAEPVPIPLHLMEACLVQNMPRRRKIALKEDVHVSFVL